MKYVLQDVTHAHLLRGRGMTLTMTWASCLPKPWDKCSAPKPSLNQQCVLHPQCYFRIQEIQRVVKQCLQCNLSLTFMHWGPERDRRGQPQNIQAVASHYLPLSPSYATYNLSELRRVCKSLRSSVPSEARDSHNDCNLTEL